MGDEPSDPSERAPTYPGTAERTDESVVKVTFRSMERGTLTRYLSPGETIDLPADRVAVEVFE